MASQHDPSSPGRNDRLLAAVLAYLRAAEAGHPPGREDWLAANADLRPELDHFLVGYAKIAEGLDTVLSAPASVDDQATLAPAPSPTSSGPAAADGPALAAGVNVPGHEILGELGRGGMGVVYKAKQLGLNRLCALKMILSGGHAGAADLARFHVEAEAIARLQHPNIVQVYGVGQLDGLPFFSLEFCGGGALDRKLNGVPMRPREAAALVKKLAEAMHAAHSANVIHRDLKPANVLLTSVAGEVWGEPKITDFGLAKKLDESGQTQTGTIMGTPSYMAPEQAEGRKDVGPLADVYALGAILYECLTGRPPFRAATPLDTVLQVVSAEPVPPTRLNAGVPRDLETICLTCLRKEPARRYASAAALAEDLRRWLAGEPIAARPVGAPERAWRWARRHPSRAATATVVLLSVIVGVAGVVWFNQRLRLRLRETREAKQETERVAAHQAAERLDGELARVAAVPELMAATLGQRQDWTPEQLRDWMKAALATNPQVYGSTAAFEPHRFRVGREDFALYVSRPNGGFAVTQLTRENYKPPYREWPWYARPREQKKAVWSEPFFDEGGADRYVVTYSVPLLRAGEVVGVVTADVPLDFFGVLRRWRQELSIRGDAYVFVVSAAGAFISHPDPAYQMPRRIGDVEAFRGDGALGDLPRRLEAQQAGRMNAVDPVTGKPSAFYYAPIRSTGWSVVVVIAD